MTTTTAVKRFVEHETTLPAIYQLPHPRDISESTLEQQASLEKRAVRILRELSQRASDARDRLDAAKAESAGVWMGNVDQMIATGQLPAIPGVVKDIAQSATGLAEKTTKYAEQGLQLIKMNVVPTSAVTSMTTLFYIDPKVTTLDEVKAQMLAHVKASFEATERAKQNQYDAAKTDIEKFHKHYVVRQKQVVSIADLFKDAKEI